MALQEGGWPLGLQPLNMRAGLARNCEFSGSISCNTLLSGSPSSLTNSSSDLDTESTGSFFHQKGITLGSLIGVSSILELSRRSIRGRPESVRSKKRYRSRAWLVSLCTKASTYNKSVSSAPSLAHFLQVERRAANDYRRNQSPMIYEPNQFIETRPVSEPNSLFVNGHVAPPQSSPWFNSDDGKRSDRSLDHDNGCGVPVLFSCMRGQAIN